MKKYCTQTQIFPSKGASGMFKTALLTLVFILLSGFATNNLQAKDNWIDYADFSWYSADATSYEIADFNQLAGLAAIVNNYNLPTDIKQNSFDKKTITLTANIDLSGKLWTPIGNYEATNYRFRGTFSGGNFTISNMEVNISSTSTIYAGLFGAILSGKVENLNVQGNVTTSSLNPPVSAYNFTGGIAGSFSGTIRNCTHTGNISASSAGNDSSAGGLVGSNNGAIYDCSHSGNITSSVISTTSSPFGVSAMSGGIAGHNKNTISNCSHSGGTISSSSSSFTNVIDAAYSGGLVGFNEKGKIYNSYARAVVRCNTSTNGHTGGVAGGARESLTIIQNNYFEGTISAASGYKGGVVGFNVFSDCNIQNNYWKDTNDTKFAIGGSHSPSGPAITNNTKFTEAKTLSENITIGTYTGKDMVFALNAWVESNQSTPIPTYLPWGRHIGENDGFPIHGVFGTDATLSALSTSGIILSPSFSSDTYSYSATVPHSTSSTIISAKPKDSKANIAGIGQKTIRDGNNNFSIVITAEDGITKKTYKVNIHRQSNDAALKSLTVSAGTLTPNFVAGTLEYNVTVPNATTSITLGATARHANATLNAADLGDKTLVVGDNEFNITVTAEDNSITSTYKVTVRRQSDDATLSDLSVSAVTLTPNFAAGTSEYNVTVPNATTSITLTATKNHANATISGDGEKTGLLVGDNKFTVVVTAEDNSFTQTYTVNVLRRDEPVTSLFDFDLTSQTYDKTARPVSVSPKPGIDGMGVISVYYNGNAAEPVNAGRYAVTIDVSEGTKYDAAADLSLGELIILPAPITVTADEGQYKVFGTSDPVFTYQSVPGQLFGNDSFTGLLNRAPGSNVGTYAVTRGSLSIADGNNGNNYVLDFQSRLFTVTAASGKITIDPVGAKTYGDGDFALSASHTGGVSVRFESVTPNIAGVYLSGGVYKVRIQRGGSAIIRAYTLAGNYEAEEDFLIVTIKRATGIAPSSLPEGLEATYGDRFRNVSLPSGFRWPDPSSMVGNVSSSPVKVPVLYNPDRNKYEDYEAELQMMIRKALPTKEVIFPTMNSTSEIVYDPDRTLDDISLNNGSGEGGFFWRYQNTVPTVGVTQYEVVFIPFDRNNYDYSGMEGWDSRSGTIIRKISLTIAPREIAISLQCDELKTYTGMPLEHCEAEVTVSELRSSQAESIALEYLYYKNGILQNEAINAGVYEVIARSADINYTGQSDPFGFTIEKAQPIILLNDTTVVYTGKPVKIAYRITGSRMASDLSGTLTFTCADTDNTETAPSEIGEYSMHVSTPGNVNHLPAEAKAILKIVPAVGIDQIASESFRIYPNPVFKNASLFLEIGDRNKEKGNCVVEVYDTNGRLLRQIPITEQKTEIRAESKEGVYLYVLRSDEGKIRTAKVVVK